MKPAFAPTPWTYRVASKGISVKARVLDANGALLMESPAWPRSSRVDAQELAKLIVTSAELLRLCLMFSSLANAGLEPSAAQLKELRAAIRAAGGKP